MSNNILTASRINSFLRCQRQHYWRYEVGLNKIQDTSLALFIGTAWHNAMEARWRDHANYEKALDAALPKKLTVDPYTAATIAGLLAAYYKHYGKDERKVKLLTEKKFDHAIAPTSFRAQGKIDKLAQIKSGRYALVEYKTTRDSIAQDSDYWLRLKFNPQLLQYRLAAGVEIEEVIYDVVRKPSIRPKQIVKTAKKKKTSKLETPNQFYERLFKDCMSRPEFYFARVEAPILAHELREFQAMRLSIVQQIQHLRKIPVATPEHAWIRNVSEQNCQSCQFKSFCLNNVSIDINNPPQGFAVQSFNPELQNETTT